MRSQGSNDCSSRRRYRFSVQVDPLDRKTFEEFECRRAGERQWAVSRASHPSPQRDAGEVKGIDLQMMDRYGCGDDVHDRVGGADFMKVHFIESATVDFSFRLGQAGENFKTLFFALGIKRALPDQVSNLFPWPLGFSFTANHPKASRANPVNGFLCDLKPVIEPGKFLQFRLELVQLQPEIEQRSE